MIALSGCHHVTGLVTGGCHIQISDFKGKYLHGDTHDTLSACTPYYAGAGMHAPHTDHVRPPEGCHGCHLCGNVNGSAVFEVTPWPRGRGKGVTWRRIVGEEP